MSSFISKLTPKNLFFYSLLFISAALVSGAFYTFQYPSINFGAFIPFALFPLFLATEKITLSHAHLHAKTVIQKSFLCLWFFGFLLQLMSFFWITKPLIYFGSVPEHFAILLFILMSILSATYFPLLFSPFIFALYFKNLFPQKRIFLFPLALCITFLEIYIPRFFDWSFGGLLSSHAYFSQLESLFGFNTGSLFIFYMSLLTSSLFLKSQKRKKIIPYAIAIVILSSVFYFGKYRIEKGESELKNAPNFRVGFIQPNFTFASQANLPLPAKDSQNFSFQTMIDMSTKLIEKSKNYDGRKINLLVWPESTAPFRFFHNEAEINQVKTLAQNSGSSFLIESIQIDPVPALKMSEQNVWSSSAVINQDGLWPEYFQKWIPMPFGEEFPLERIWPASGEWFRDIFQNSSKIERGTSFQSLPVGENIFVTPLICFDTISQKLSYLSTKYGNASFFVNQANFVWMVDSNAGLELALLDKMRAIENGRSLVVASNTGPSMAFDPFGKVILAPTKLLTQNINFVDIPLYKEKTLFQSVSHWPLDILGLLSFCYLIILRIKNHVPYKLKAESDSE